MSEYLELYECSYCGKEITLMKTWGDDIIVEVKEQRLMVRVRTRWSERKQREEPSFELRNVLVIHECN